MKHSQKVFSKENIISAIIMVVVSIAVGKILTWELIVPVALAITVVKAAIDEGLRGRKDMVAITAMFICIPSILVMTVMSMY